MNQLDSEEELNRCRTGFLDAFRNFVEGGKALNSIDPDPLGAETLATQIVTGAIEKMAVQGSNAQPPTSDNPLPPDVPGPTPAPADCQVPPDQCEPGDVGFDTCESLGFGPGTLRCNQNCTFDTSDCGPSAPAPCNIDGVLDDSEICEPGILGGATCENRGFGPGMLRCNQNCTFDTSDCGPPATDRCRIDGVLDDFEDCEPGILGSFTCEILGRGPGTLRCNDSCGFDTSGCGDPSELCGNGILNSGEDCDGPIPPPFLECGDVDDRFAGGTLSCTDDCRFDTSGCEEAPVCLEQTCPDGSCAPSGADCCGGGSFCAPGTVCAGDGCCANTNTICPDGSCFPPSAVCCGGGVACPGGTVCTGDGACCPGNAPLPCPGGFCTSIPGDCS